MERGIERIDKRKGERRQFQSDRLDGKTQVSSGSEVCGRYDHILT